LLGKQQLIEAESFFLEGVARDPTYTDCYTNLGVVLLLQGKSDDALAAFDTALSLDPNHAGALVNAGFALFEAGDMAGARAKLEAAAKLGLATAHLALGKLLHEAGEEDLALRHLREGLRLEPNDIQGRIEMRQLMHHYGDEAAAIEQCDEVIRLQPNHPLHPQKKALVMLTYGNLQGWEEYECRYYTSVDTLTRVAQQSPKAYAESIIKRWDGKPTGHLLVHREQGYGDNIQMLRFIPEAAKRCEKLSLFLPPALRRLATLALRDLPNVQVIEDLLPPTEFDRWCLIMSMPYLLGMPANFPNAPYMVAPPDQYGEIRELPGLKVGIAWSGNPDYDERRWRDIPFEQMAKLFDVSANFVSLRFPSEVDKSRYPLIDVYPTPSSYFGHLMVDWMETAALIDTLDLIISADTGVAHLAGALGKPVWMLNRYNSDWRWGLRSKTTPWYPSMRIFRQPRLGDWDTVLDQVVAELRRMID
jgi:tetratricopeptide (TPR) repeat protein